jgi:hypothetical protein
MPYRTDNLQMLHFKYLFNKYPYWIFQTFCIISFFSSSKCRLFHNATFFGSCTIHILNTGCANIWKKKSGAKGLRSGVNWQIALQEKCLKQSGVKQGLVAHYELQVAGDDADVENMQGMGNTAMRPWSYLFLCFVYFRTLSDGRLVNSRLETRCREAVTIWPEVLNRCLAGGSKESRQNRQIVRFQAEIWTQDVRNTKQEFRLLNCEVLWGNTVFIRYWM